MQNNSYTVQDRLYMVEQIQEERKQDISIFTDLFDVIGQNGQQVQRNLQVYGTFDKPLFKVGQIKEIFGDENIYRTIQTYTQNEVQRVSQNNQYYLTKKGLIKYLSQSRKPLAKQIYDNFVLQMIENECKLIQQTKQLTEFKTQRLLLEKNNVNIYCLFQLPLNGSDKFQGELIETRYTKCQNQQDFMDKLHVLFTLYPKSLFYIGYRELKQDPEDLRRDHQKLLKFGIKKIEILHYTDIRCQLDGFTTEYNLIKHFSRSKYCLQMVNDQHNPARENLKQLKQRSLSSN